jgi:membrane-bound lytic murein transglycosylase B
MTSRRFPLKAFALAAVLLPVAVAQAEEPSVWTLSMKISGGSRAKAALIQDWTAKPEAAGERALTKKEAEALLDDPRAQLVYGDRTVAILAPSNVDRQHQEHVDLLQAFLAPEKMSMGEKFFAEHRRTLELVEKQFHVEPTVVASILMWESQLGTVTGKYAAFNALASQALFAEDASAVALGRPEEQGQVNPQRQQERVDRIRKRARRNLAILVRTCKARGLDALAVKGSWAGALGYPQFMPASLRWAEDGDGDGKVDLDNLDDAAASVARFLKEHGFGKSRERAVMAYNHETAYVTGVLAWADALSAQLKKSAPDGGAPSDAGVAGAL